MAIGLTLLAYRYEGMRLTDLRDVARSLKRQLLQEQGAFEERPSHVLMRAFVESGVAEQRAARRAAARAKEAKPRPHLLHVASIDRKVVDAVGESAREVAAGHEPSRVRRLRGAHTETTQSAAVDATTTGDRQLAGCAEALTLIRRESQREAMPETAADDEHHDAGRAGGVLPLHLLQPEDGEHLAALSRAARYSRPLIAHYLRSFVFPAVLRPQRAKTTATGHDLASDAIFRCVLGFSGTASDLVPLSLLPVQYEAGTDAAVARVLTNPDCVSIVHFPSVDWDVMKLLQFVAASPRYRSFIDLGAAVTGLSSRAVAAALLTMGLAHVDGAVYVEPDGRRCVLLRALAAEAVGESATAAPTAGVALAGGPANALQIARRHALPSALAALPATAAGGAALHGDVMRSPLFRALMTRVTPIPLARSGVPKERLFAVFSQAHCTGTDIPQAADTVALLTVGPGATWRDFSQAAYRLRQLGHGQRVHTLVTREVAGLIRSACAGLPVGVCAGAARATEAGDAHVHLTPLHLAAWLLQNSHRQESAQRLSLTSQRLAHIGRSHSLRVLLGTSIRDLQSVAEVCAKTAAAAALEAAKAIRGDESQEADALATAKEMAAVATAAAASADAPVVHTRFLWGLPAIPPPWLVRSNPAAEAPDATTAGAGAGAGGASRSAAAAGAGDDAAGDSGGSSNEAALPLTVVFRHMLAANAGVAMPWAALPPAVEALLQLAVGQSKSGVSATASEASSPTPIPQADDDAAVARDAWLRTCAGSHLEQMHHDISAEPLPAPSFVGTLAEDLLEQRATLAAALASDPTAEGQLQHVLAAVTKRLPERSRDGTAAEASTSPALTAVAGADRADEKPSPIDADELLADARLDTEQQQEVEQEVEVLTEVQSDRPVSATGLDACGNTPWRLASLLRFVALDATRSAGSSNFAVDEPLRGLQLDLARGDPYPFALMLHGAASMVSQGLSVPAAAGGECESVTPTAADHDASQPGGFSLPRLMISCNHTRLRGQPLAYGADAGTGGSSPIAAVASSAVQLITPPFMRNVYALGQISAVLINASGCTTGRLGGGTVVLSLAEAESLLLQLRAAGHGTTPKRHGGCSGPSVRVSVALELLPPSSTAGSAESGDAARGTLSCSIVDLPLPYADSAVGLHSPPLRSDSSAAERSSGIPTAAVALARLLDGQVWLSQAEVAALLTLSTTDPAGGSDFECADEHAARMQALVPTSAATGPPSWGLSLPLAAASRNLCDINSASRQRLFACLLQAHRRDRPSPHGTSIAPALVLPDATTFAAHMRDVAAARAALVRSFGSLPAAFAALCACAGGVSAAASSDGERLMLRARIRAVADAALSDGRAQVVSAAAVRPDLLLRTSLSLGVLTAALEELLPSDAPATAPAEAVLRRLSLNWTALLALKDASTGSVDISADGKSASAVGTIQLLYFDILALLQTGQAESEPQDAAAPRGVGAITAASPTSEPSALPQVAARGSGSSPTMKRLPASTVPQPPGSPRSPRARAEASATTAGGAGAADVARHRGRLRALRRVAAGQLSATEVSAVGELAVRDIFTAPVLSAASNAADGGMTGSAHVQAAQATLPRVCIHDGTIIRIGGPAAGSAPAMTTSWEASALVATRALLLQPPAASNVHPSRDRTGASTFVADTTEPAWFFECQVSADVQDYLWLALQAGNSSPAAAADTDTLPHPVAALGVLLHSQSRSTSANAGTAGAVRSTSDSLPSSRYGAGSKQHEPAAVDSILGVMIRSDASGRLTAAVNTPTAYTHDASSGGAAVAEQVIEIPAGARIGFAVQYGVAGVDSALCLRMMVTVNGAAAPQLQPPLIPVAPAAAGDSSGLRLVGAQPAAWLRQGFAVALDLGRYRRHGLAADDLSTLARLLSDGAEAAAAAEAADRTTATAAVTKQQQRPPRVQWAWDAVLRLVSRVMREQAGSTMGSVIGASGSAQLKITQPATKPVSLTAGQQTRLAELLRSRSEENAGAARGGSPARSRTPQRSAATLSRVDVTSDALPAAAGAASGFAVRPEEWRVECLPIARFPSALVSGVAVTHGRVYFEIMVGDAGIGQVGIADVRFVGASLRGVGVGDDKSSFAADGHRQLTWFAGSRTFGGAWRTGSVLGVALDLDARTVAFSLDGSWAAPWGTAFVNTAASGGWTPALSLQRWRPSFSGTLCLGAAVVDTTAAPAAGSRSFAASLTAGTQAASAAAGGAGAGSAGVDVPAASQSTSLRVATTAAFRFAPPSPDYKPMAAVWLPCIDECGPADDDSGHRSACDGAAAAAAGSEEPSQTVTAQVQPPYSLSPWRVAAGAANALINPPWEVLRRMLPDLPADPPADDRGSLSAGLGASTAGGLLLASTWGTVVVAMQPQRQHGGKRKAASAAAEVGGSDARSGSEGGEGEAVDDEGRQLLLRVQVIRPGSSAISVRSRRMPPQPAGTAGDARSLSGDAPATLLDVSDARSAARALLLGPLPLAAGAASALLHVQPFTFPSEDEDHTARSDSDSTVATAIAAAPARRPRWLELLPSVADLLRLCRAASGAGATVAGEAAPPTAPSDAPRVLEASFLDKAEPLGLIDNRAARRAETAARLPVSVGAGGAAASESAGALADEEDAQRAARAPWRGGRLMAFSTATATGTSPRQPEHRQPACTLPHSLLAGDVVEVHTAGGGEVCFTVYRSGAASPFSVQLTGAQADTPAPSESSTPRAYEVLLAMDPGCVLRADLSALRH